MSRVWNFGQVMMTTDEYDVVDIGWDPTNERVRIVTRSPEHVRQRRGSLMSMELTVDQFRSLILVGANLMDMIERGRMPGDTPLPADSPLEVRPGDASIDAPVGEALPEAGKTWKGNA